MSRQPLRQWLLVALVAAFVASACDSSSPPATAPGSQQVASVQIDTAGTLLAGPGTSRKLSAVATAANGAPLNGVSVSWASSDPTVATVDASGTVTAVAPAGYTRITASVGSSIVSSADILVAEPVDGAILLTDDQIVEGPIAVDPPPPGSFPFEAVLHGVDGVVEGAIVINTGSKAVVGQVVSVTPQGDDTLVRLVLLPVGRMFKHFLWRDTIDLAEGPYDIPEAIAGAFDATQEGPSLSFKPRGGATAAIDQTIEHAARAVSPASWTLPRDAELHPAAVSSPLPPFGGCGKKEDEEDANLPPMPVSLSLPPALSINVAGDVSREVTETGTTYRLRATPKITFELSLELKAALEAELLTCKLTFFSKRFRLPPIGIVLALLGGKVNFGAGFTVGGEATLASLKVGGKLEYQPTFAGHLTCPTSGECTIGGDETPPASAKFSPIWKVPSLGQANISAKLELFGFIAVDAGSADIGALQFEALKAKVGLELGASLTLEGLQIANTDASEGRSKYELGLKAGVGPGIKLGKFFEYLGIKSAVPLKLGFKLPLGESPKGSVRADKARYLPGEVVKLHVKLDPASTVFPAGFGIYNVAGVIIGRRDGLTLEVFEEVAGDGRTEFDIEFESTHLLDASELYAFVLTKLLPIDPPKLEIGKASAPIIWTFDAGLEGWSTYGRGKRSETKPWGEAKWRATPGGGAARLSGVGEPSRINSQLYRTIELPADAAKLVFKASADLGHAYADSELRVRITVNGASTELHRAIYTNTTSKLKYTTVELDISRFAGQTVRIVFEQNDDGDGQHEHIYLDDIEIRSADE